MELEAMTPELAEEILRENGHSEEADQFLNEISTADSEQAGGLIASLKQRALRVLREERTREQIDASWTRMASGGDMDTEIERVSKL